MKITVQRKTERDARARDGGGTVTGRGVQSADLERNAAKRDATSGAAQSVVLIN